MNSLLRIGQLLGVNAVPAWGLFAEGWTPATALLLYWVENLLSTILVGLRIAIHRHLTQMRGHYKVAEVTVRMRGKHNVEKRPTTFLSNFLLTAIPFNIAHGLFVAIIVGVGFTRHNQSESTVQLIGLREGAAMTAALLLFGFVLDLFNMREKPFAWIRRLTEFTLGRVVVVHLTIVLGMFAMVMFNRPEALFALFIGLKTLVDIGSRLPQKEAPKEAPTWLVRISNKIGPANPKDGDFAEHYRKKRQEEIARQADDELPMKREPARRA